MKITLYAGAFSPHNLDALKAVLEKQLKEYEAQIKHTICSDNEVTNLHDRCVDLIAAIYTIDRTLAE